MDRQGAIALLKARGFVVNERTWALGESISVAVGPRIADGITFYAALEYIFPESDVSWGLTDLAQNKPSRTFPSLEDAVAAVTDVMNSAISKLSD